MTRPEGITLDTTVPTNPLSASPADKRGGGADTDGRPPAEDMAAVDKGLREFAEERIVQAAPLLNKKIHFK